MNNRIDPKLLAAGIGGLIGANALSTGDNDLVATAAGAGIGIGTGLLLDTNLSDEERSQIGIRSKNLEKVIDPEQISKTTKTFEERKKEVRKLAEEIAKQRKGTGDFDRNKPFSSLTKDNFDDFLTDLDNIKSDESLTKLKVSLVSGKDELFVSKGDLDTSLKLDDNFNRKIQAGASLKTKMEALKDEFIRLGYKDGSKDLENKLKMFEGLMDGHGHKEQIRIQDGKLKLDKDLTINLTYKSVSEEGDVAIQSAQNKNIYNIPRVSFTASGHLQDGMTNKAMAEALGITMADAFKEQMEREMKEVAGLAPDEAAALAYKNLKDKPAQFREMVNTLNGMRMHDEVASGQYKDNLRQGKDIKPKPSTKAVSISNTVDYSQTLNFLENGQINKEQPFRKTGVTAKKGKKIPEIKQFLEKKIQQTGIPNSGTSADHVTEMTTTQMEKVSKSGKTFLAPTNSNSLLTVHTAHERNPVSVYNRMLSHDTKDLPHKAAFDYITKITGSQSQFGSALPLQTMSLNSKKEIVSEGGLKQSQLFVDMIADVFGSNITVADGAGLGNRDILRKISTEGFVNLDMTPTADDKFLFADEYHKKVSTGELSFDDFKAQAKKGIGAIQGKSEVSLRDIRSKLNTIQTLTSSNDSAKDILGKLQKSLPKVFARNSTEVKKIMASGTREEQIEALQKLGKSKVMLKIPTVESLFNKEASLTDTAIEARRKISTAFSKIEKQTSLQKTISALDSFIDTNADNKKYVGAAESFFPKAGQVIGYNSDGSEVKLKQNYRSYEFAGTMWNNKTTDYSSSTLLSMMFKGKAVVGDEEEIKTYGLGTKAQLQNIEGDQIQKIAFLHDLAEEDNLQVNIAKKSLTLNIKDAAGEDKKLTVRMASLRDKSLRDIFKESNIDISDEMSKKIDNYKHIAVLAEDDSSGTKKHADLLKKMLNGEDVSKVPTSSLLGNYIQTKTQSLTGDKEALAGLADFVLATSKDKSAMDYLVTTHLSVIQQSGLRFATYTKAVGSEKEAALAEMKRYGQEMFGVDFSSHTAISKKEWGEAMEQRIKSVTQYHTSAGFSNNFYTMANDPSQLDNFANFFINERKNRSETLGNSLLKPTASNRTVEHELGSGSTGKNASWNSMAQLRMNGFSNSDIGLFAKMSSENAADYQAVSMLTKRVRDSLETRASSDQIKTIINTATNQRRDALAGMGHATDKLVESYSLKSENSLGIQSLPILLEDSRLFGGYTDEEGNVRSKRLSKVINQAIQADISLSEATTDLERKSYKASLEDSLSYITKNIISELGGQDNLAKKVATLEAPRSMYSLASPSGGAGRRYAKEVLGDNHVISVTSQGLLKRFADMGMEFETLEDVKKAGLLKRTKEKGVFEVFYDKEQKVPMFGMLTREPSVGMGSTSTVRYLLDTSIKGGSKNLYSMFDNEIFKAFKMQDFDMDHFIEVLPEVKKSNMAQLQEIYSVKGKKINDQLDDMLEMAKYMGVKGKDKGRISSFFDLLDNPELDTHEKFNKAFLEDAFYSKLKSGDRKTVSPTVTKLSFTMNAALNKLDMSFVDRSNARMMTHYLVENLLKSQHISNSTYKQDPIALASKMAADLEAGRVENFNEKFGRYVEENIIQPNKTDTKFTPKIEGYLRNAVASVQRSMIASKDIVNGNLTPTHLRGQNPAFLNEGQLGFALDEGIKNLNQVVEGTQMARGQGVVSTIDQEIVDSTSASLAGRTKKSYHNALETTKQIISNNKKILAGAAAATIGAALLTQDKPNFGNQKVGANTNGMLMESSRNALEETREQQSLMGGVGKATDYLYSYNRSNSKSVSVEGYQTGYGSSGNISNDINNFMFADGMSTVRILTE